MKNFVIYVISYKTIKAGNYDSLPYKETNDSTLIEKLP